MKIQIKTLKNQRFDLEIKETDTIMDIKHLIDAQLKLGAPDTQRLIFSGKILRDEQTVADAKLKENDFLVCMTSKAVPAKKPAAPIKPEEKTAATPNDVAPVAAVPPAAGTQSASSSTTATTTASAASSTSTPAPAAPAATPAAPAQPAPPAPAAPSSGASTLVTGKEYNDMVAQLMGLGNFSHDQVVTALRASFNNPERAADYLFNPEALQAAIRSQGLAPRAGAGAGAGAGQAGSAAQAGAQAASSAGGAGSGGAGAAGGGAHAGAGGQQAALMALLQSNPQLLQMIMQQAAQQDPQLQQMMQTHPEAVMELLNNPQIAGQLLAGLAAAGALPGAGHGRGGGGVTIELTQGEAEAVDRLERLGFSRDRALEAFLICDKNEDVAANYLFDHPMEQEEDQ